MLFLLLILLINPNLNFASENDYRIIWQKTISYEGNDDVVEVISSDDAIYVIGITNHGNYDNIIHKMDSKGNLIWTRLFGNLYDDFPTTAVLLNDTLIVASKSTRRPSDPEPWLESTLLYAVDTNGNKLWEKFYEKSELYEIHELRKSIDGDLLAAGTAIVQSDGNARDYSISILSKKGDIIWNKTLGQDDKSENAYSVLNSPDGGLIFTGNVFYPPPEAELIKIDSTGNIQWRIDYGLWQVEGYKLFMTTKKEILLFYSDWDPQTPNPYQIFLKKYSFNGAELLERRYDIPDISGINGKLRAVIAYEESSYLMLDAFSAVTCINESGDINWHTKIYLNNPKSLASLNDSLFVIADKIPSGFDWDIRISLLSFNGDVTNVKNPNANTLNLRLSQNYPNPFNPVTTIKYYLSEPDNVIIKIYNIAGQEIETLINGYQLEGEHIIEWCPKGLPSGTYLYRLQTSEFSETKTLILQK